MKLLFVTGNAKKFSIGKSICNQHGIELQQIVADIPEIQGEDPEIITRNKAMSAYKVVGKPVIVSDDSWDIPGLNGFPGPYMKSMNAWFTAQDFINLTHSLKDRRAYVQQFLAYSDEYETVLFRQDIGGTLLDTPKGTSHDPWRMVITMDGDNGKSLAEIDEDGTTDTPERLAHFPQPWDDLIKWLEKKNEH
jgi:XTP/dITP diphosphohydrolase